MKKEQNLNSTETQALNIPVVSGSFKVGDKIVVCEELFTTIDHFEGNKVWFYDDYVKKLRYCNINDIQLEDECNSVD